MDQDSHLMERESEKYAQLRSKLTKRELEVVLLMTEAMSYEEIANKLFLAISTIRKHSSNIFNKAEVKNKPEFIREYPNIKRHIESDNYRTELDHKLSGVFDLSWKDDNAFENYFSEYYSVIEAMCQMDFSKRMHESGEKDSFVNLIAQGLNMVNSELEERYLGAEIVPALMEYLGEKNRIVMLSNNGKTVSHAISTIGIGSLKAERWIGVPIKELVTKNQLNILKKEGLANYNTELRGKHFPLYLHGNAQIKVEKISNHTVICITTFPENRFSEQMPRILSLLSNIKSQYEDNPSLAKNIMGEWIFLEVESIYKQFEEFVFTD